jgi:hypothetical protein
MSRWIDADIYVTATLYDDEHEEYRDERMTIADCLDRFTDEGCPTKAEPKQGEWIDKAISIIDDMRGEGIVDYEQAREFRMRARMKGANDGKMA